MSCVYPITNDHCWGKFFTDLYREYTARALNSLEMQSRLPVIEAALKEYNATIIVAETSRGEKYVEAAVFEKEEDLVVFKLIYS